MVPFSDAQICYLFACLFGDDAEHALAVLNEEAGHRTACQRIVLQLPAEGIFLAEVERAVIVAALKAAPWQKDAAAKLGISARKLNYMMKTHHITRPRDAQDVLGHTPEERAELRAEADERERTQASDGRRARRKQQWADHRLKAERNG